MTKTDAPDEQILISFQTRIEGLQITGSNPFDQWKKFLEIVLFQQCCGGKSTTEHLD
eukprot:CAMPEP_0116864202 /NCGR_PEP_ID=MMETSP0418-20121206/24683_1 /TAXON_ID=1158023 /ORGANISM="Astrosyne radiata, Strain 13vi08-1A" /LENGTH=56 /DNA_ID=CAMNT_0004499381 /DNA_START=348 /DNA_END=515 /DNA_ORIENTATION=-